MHPYFIEYLGTVRLLQEELLKQMDGLGQAGLDWTPCPGANSLAVLAAHLAGSQRYWLSEVLGARPSQRDRDAEFATRGAGRDRLVAQLEAALEEAAATVGSLSLDSLAEVRLSPRHGREYTVAWVLHHALEHLAQHVGHAQLTRQLWDERERVA